MEHTNNVVHMDDYLVKRYHKYANEANRLNELADELSKQQKDKFAAPVRTKAEAAMKKAKDMENQIRFIMRGGIGKTIPNNGYQPNVPSTPAPIKFNFPDFTKKD